MKGRADKRGASKPAKKGGGKANGSVQMPVGYLAEILGQLKEVSGWEDGKWLLAGGARYGFKPLCEDGPGYHNQRLLAVSELRLKDGEWLLDGDSLEGWLRAEEQRAEKARNAKRVKRGLKPVAFAVTPDYTAVDFASGKSPPNSSAETRRLDLHPHYWRRLYLLSYLEGVMPVGGNEFDGADRASVRAVAWFEGEEDGGDPVLLRDFWPDQSPAAPPAGFKACPTCGWHHDTGDFTQMVKPGEEAISLTGICPDIVAVVHRAHEKGLPWLGSKDDELIAMCGSGRHPNTVFNQRAGGRDAYKRLFRTKRGFISLKGYEVGQAPRTT